MNMTLGKEEACLILSVFSLGAILVLSTQADSSSKHNISLPGEDARNHLNPTETRASVRG